MSDRPPRLGRRVQSPCVGVCVLDEASGYCCGCLRTRDEIAGWLTYTDEERQRVVDSLGDRKLPSDSAIDLLVANK